MLRPTNRRLVILTVAIAFCAVGLTQAGGRTEIAPGHADRAAQAAQRAFAGAQDAPISIHRLLRDRVDLMLRTARAFESDPDDDPIRGNGLSDGPDPTDSRAQSEYDESEESKSDGDRSDEYQDAVDQASSGDEAPQELTMH